MLSHRSSSLWSVRQRPKKDVNNSYFDLYSFVNYSLLEHRLILAITRKKAPHIMPRVTRAALRSNAAFQDSDLAVSVPLPLTPCKERPPLGEIAGNALENSHPDSGSSETIKAQRRSAVEGKKGRAAKKVKSKSKASNEDLVEVLEDDNRSASSSAVDEACEDLLKNEVSIGSLQYVLPDEDHNMQSSHANDAIQDTELQGSMQHHNANTPTNRSAAEPGEVEDSFVNVIKSRTPARMTINETDLAVAGSADIVKSGILEAFRRQDESSNHKQGTKEDSFVDNIMVRSPTKIMTRIEDSVEAIDAFEDEIEKVGELIPTVSDAVSPIKTKKLEKTVARNAASKSRTARVTKTMSVRAPGTATSKATGASQESQKSRIHSGQALKKNNGDCKISVFDNDAPNIAAKRISSIHKAPFQPVKSTKPPTKSNFELPGDAISRKVSILYASATPLTTGISQYALKLNFDPNN